LEFGHAIFHIPDLFFLLAERKGISAIPRPESLPCQEAQQGKNNHTNGNPACLSRRHHLPESIFIAHGKVIVSKQNAKLPAMTIW
jgi:hypothetical protein